MIQVINRALDILELMATNRGKLFTLSEISGELKLNNGTCANIIKTLVTRGYIEQKGRKTGYCLGSMAYLLTGNYLYKKEILNSAIEHMNRLATEFNEGCILSILKDNTRIILHEIKSSHELQVVNKKEKEAYSTSTGRMLLACLTAKEQNNFIRTYGLPLPEVWPGIEDEDDLILELQKIRKKQLAVQISKAQIVGLAVPIFKNKEVVASLGIYLPQSRYTGSRQGQLDASIKHTGDLINQELNTDNTEPKKETTL